MSKKTRFNTAIDYLMSCGKIHKQKDIAEALSSTETTISQARKGVERALTDNLLMRFLIAYPDIFSVRWLIEGEGNMLICENNTSPVMSKTYSVPYDDSPKYVSDSGQPTLESVSRQIAVLSQQLASFTSIIDVRLNNIEKQLANLQMFPQNNIKNSDTI